MSMNLTSNTVILGLDDCKIAELLTDADSAPVYGESVDVPGIRSLKLTPTFAEKELRGDESILDTYSKLEKIDWSIEYGKVSLDALEVIIGGKVTGTETKQTYDLTGLDKAPYFKLETQSLYADVGDVHFTLYKCKCTSLDITLQGEEYAVISAGGKAIPALSNGKVKSVEFNQEAVPLT